MFFRLVGLDYLAYMNVHIHSKIHHITKQLHEIRFSMKLFGLII